MHQGGATFVAADSVGPVARFLAEHPEGAYPPQNAWTGCRAAAGVLPLRRSCIAQCDDFVEATGEVGDVYLLHPFVLHAKAQNVLRVPRYITNPPVHLVEPMRFDRADPDEFSLVERAVLRGLGVDRYPFTATGPREQLVPERVAAAALDEAGRAGSPGRRRAAPLNRCRNTDDRWSPAGSATCSGGAQVPWLPRGGLDPDQVADEALEPGASGGRGSGGRGRVWPRRSEPRRRR